MDPKHVLQTSFKNLRMLLRKKSSNIDHQNILWTTGPSDYWAFGLSGLRTIGHSDYRAFGLLDRHRVIRALRIVQKLYKDVIKTLHLNSTIDQKYFWKTNRSSCSKYKFAIGPIWI